MTLHLRKFDVASRTWQVAEAQLRAVRTSVFVEEQKTAVEEEFDAIDIMPNTIHFLATDLDGEAIGTARLLATGQIGRMAVLKSWRGEKVGSALITQAIDGAIKAGLDEVFLNAQTHALAFYKNFGFESCGETFDEVGIEHIEMRMSLIEKIKAANQSQQHHKQAPDPVLPPDKETYQLQSQNEFQQQVLSSCEQARKSIKIYSPRLDHKLFDHDDLVAVISKLARKNRYTHVEILVHETHAIVKHGHRLLEISRKLSSSIKIKCVHSDDQVHNHEFVLLDNQAYIYRKSDEAYVGRMNHCDHTENDRLDRLFTRIWQNAEFDANLRQLNI